MRAALLFLAVACTPTGGEPPPVEVDITWDTPLEESWIGLPVGDDIVGHSLGEIVSGQVEARGAGRSCSACHFDQSVTLYRPEHPQFAMDRLGPYDILDGRTWAGNTGWAAIFDRQQAGAFVEKPPELREAFRLWALAENARVEPLTWTDPVTIENSGVEPDPNIAGKSIDNVLNSRITGRPDDLLCSECHYQDGPIAYRPEIAQGLPSAFGPDDVLDGRPWSGPTGWALRFCELGGNGNFHKPDYLRSTFFKWYDDGGE